MATQLRTIIEKIEVDIQTGYIGLKMLKQVVDNDGKVIFSEPHRASISPTVNPPEIMAVIHADLNRRGFPNAPPSEIALMEQTIGSMNTLRAQKAVEEAQKAAAAEAASKPN